MKAMRNVLGCGLILALIGCASNPEPESGPTDSGSPATERTPAARGPSLDQAREAPFAVQHRGSRPQRQERPRVVRIDNTVEVASVEPEAPRPQAAEAPAPVPAAPVAAPRTPAEPLLGEVNARPPSNARPPANRTTETRTATPARQPSSTPTRPAPAPQPRAPSSTPAGTRSHVVAQGETLFSLARRYGVSVDAIRTANKLPDTNIRIGQKLIIPAS